MARIVVIDDDEQIQRMLGLILERGGHEPILIGDPVAGLDYLKTNKPDLLVLDVMMPDMSGHDVARQIRATKSIEDLPIVILTARTQEVDREAALQAGANCYLSKPIEAQELLSAVDDLIFKRGVSQHATDSGGYVISVLGLRGGVGCTTMAVNLASSLRRASQQQVCLVDLSLSGGQVTMHFRMPAQSSWGDILDKGDSWQEQIGGLLLQHRSGVYILSAPTLPQSPDMLSEPIVRELLEILCEQMQFVVIDLPSVLSPVTLTALQLSNMTLHLVTPDLISVQVGAQTNRALANAGIQLRQKAHLLNYPSPETNVPVSVIERGLGTRLAFTIEHDPNQARALAQGVPLSLTNAQSPLPLMMRRMAEAIWQRVAEKKV